MILNSTTLRWPREESSEVWVGYGLGEEIHRVLSAAPGPLVFLVDPAVNDRARALAHSLSNTKLVLLADQGESAKSLNGLAGLAQQMLDGGIQRDATLVSVGGGVVTDLGGFLAATYMRGLRSVFISTSLLGMVDAAIGGKTGVHLGAFKNMLGVIRQPDQVFCDTQYLETLPQEHRREGLVEVMKMAAMLNAEDFHRLESTKEDLVGADKDALLDAVATGVRLKSSVILDDVDERGLRKFLNFGHTVGHAIESASDFSISHGEAVARGMAIECRHAESEVTASIESMVRWLGYEPELPTAMTAQELVTWMRHDKKTSSRGDIVMAVPKTLGEGHLVKLDQKTFVERV